MGTCDICHRKTDVARMEIPVFLGNYSVSHSSWGHPFTGNVCPQCLKETLKKALGFVEKGLSYDGER